MQDWVIVGAGAVGPEGGLGRSTDPIVQRVGRELGVGAMMTAIRGVCGPVFFARLRAAAAPLRVASETRATVSRLVRWGITFLDVTIEEYRGPRWRPLFVEPDR